ncbi:uracil phosphoribosyltransferase [Legionella sp. W05-934-2]|jgi:uracil phosphoribosyltransferase|uniref:uracil phosphoribosyltransferase n=1 Tax=Legionella sp. W05-934-2 TaxID=1198649 RepID=UPI0034638072
MTTQKVIILDHPLIQHKLTELRDKYTQTREFRSLIHEVSLLMAYEITRHLPLKLKTIETPLMPMEAPTLAGKKPIFVSILRAGNALLDGMLQLIPSAKVGHVGLYRDHDTLKAVEYYFKMPPHCEKSDFIVLDPMLATGNTAVAAITRIKALNPKSIVFLCLLAAPEGIEALHKVHPDIPIYTAAVDEKLNDKKYILPGLGDAGDRLYGTK